MIIQLDPSQFVSVVSMTGEVSPLGKLEAKRCDFDIYADISSR